jgi:hypothetical protein
MKESAVSNQYNYRAIQCIAALGTTGLTTTERQALNYLCEAIQDNDLWQYINCVFPFIGSPANGTLFRNAILPISPFVGQFNSSTFTGAGWTYSNGVTTAAGNNATYFNTGWVAASHGAANDFHIALYSSTNTAPPTTNSYDVGNTNGATSIQQLSLLGGASKNLLKFNINNIALSVTNTNAIGCFIGTEVPTVGTFLYKNGTQMASGANSNGDITAARQIYLGNTDTTGGASTTGFTNQKYSFLSIGKGLSATNIAIYNSIITNFITILGR